MNKECIEFTTQLKPFEAWCPLQKFAHVGKVIAVKAGGEEIFEAIKRDDHVLACKIHQGVIGGIVKDVVLRDH